MMSDQLDQNKNIEVFDSPLVVVTFLFGAKSGSKKHINNTDDVKIRPPLCFQIELSNKLTKTDSFIHLEWWKVNICQRPCLHLHQATSLMYSHDFGHNVGDTVVCI